jgi:hypothetical protein
MTDYIQNINLSWDSTDTSPILAGNLDVNNNSIVSINNGDINIVPDGTGRLILDTIRVDGNSLSTVNGQPLSFTNNVTFQSDITLQGDVITSGAGTPEIESSTALELTAGTRVVITSSPIKMASFSSGERNGLTPENGDVIYNTTTNKFQGYANGSWVDLH